jgi:TonB family protein
VKPNVIVLGSVALVLFAITPVRAYAQSCAGLYDAANGVLLAYSRYDVQSSRGGSAPVARARKAMIIQANEFLNYGTAYLRAADGIDTDDDALISQCDNYTRIAVYKAGAETEVFLQRVDPVNSKSYLDAGSLLLYRLMLVLKKSNREDGDLAQLNERLKNAYGRAHLSMPQNLINVDSYVKSAAPAGSADTARTSCANPDVGVTVTNPVQPDNPKSASDIGLGAISVEVQVMVGPTGQVVGVSVYKSSSNMAIDQAALQAARQSTYSPALKNCHPTGGDYLFRADFQP